MQPPQVEWTKHAYIGYKSTLSICVYPEEKAVISTNLLMKRLGVDDAGLARHDALDDSRLIAKIFVRIMEQYRERYIDSLKVINPMTVKRFQLPET